MFGQGLRFLSVTLVDPKLIIFPVLGVRCLKRLAKPASNTVDLYSLKNDVAKPSIICELASQYGCLPLRGRLVLSDVQCFGTRHDFDLSSRGLRRCLDGENADP